MAVLSPVARLGVAQSLSLAGDRVHHLAVLAFCTAAATAAGESPAAAVFGLSAAMFLPGLVLAPLVGGVVDRVAPAAVLAWVDAVRCLLVLGLAWALAAWSLPFAIAALFVLYSLNAVFLPARGALPPRLVPPHALHRANTWLTASAVGAAVLATALAGWCVDRIGWSAALVLDAFTYGVSALLLASLVRIAPAAPPPAGRRPPTGPAWGPAGFALLWRGLRARRAAATWAALWGAGGVLHVAGAARWLGGSGEVARLGYFGAALALGALAGAALSRGRSGVRRRGAALLFAGAAATLGAVALVQHPVAVALALAGLGACAAPIAAWSETELQRAVPSHRRATAFAARESLARLAFLGGAGLALVVTQLGGTAGAMGLGAVALGLAALGTDYAFTLRGAWLRSAPAAARTD